MDDIDRRLDVDEEPRDSRDDEGSRDDRLVVVG